MNQLNQPKILALFPGQGSQRVGMGLDLYEKSPLAKEYFRRADQALGFSLSRLCFEGPNDQLTATAIAQPAILTVSTICFAIANSEKKLNVVASAGHSLGEYSALVASGALTFEEAVKLVHQRGQFMQQAVPLGQGKMFAILGKEPKELEDAIAKVKTGTAQIANLNAPGQIVVAGDVAGCAELLALLPGCKSIELPVSAPFHCSLMKPAEVRLAEELKSVSIQATQFPVYANVTATAIETPEQTRSLLVQQVCSSVRWVESVQNAIREKQPDLAIEFGSGNVLSGLMKRIAPSLKRETLGLFDQIGAWQAAA